jgi:hypothetical protein
MTARFRVTYETVTYESAEAGDAAERGWIQPGGWHYQDAPEGSGNDAPMTLREALSCAGPDEDCGRWWTETGSSRADWRTGAVETRAIHPPANITAASYARVSRLLGIKPARFQR